MAKPTIAIVGAGNLASALAPALRQAGYVIDAVIGRAGARSQGRARRLAKEVGADTRSGLPKSLRAQVVWLCVPDSQIADAAELLAANLDGKKQVALHSSGALISDELVSLRRRGAAVASVHPLMTFVRRSRPRLAGVPFAIEGDAAAVRVARQIVRDLGGQAYPIHKTEKAAYHAWGTFASPLFTALLATTERVAPSAGVPPKAARRRMIPILMQTLANYAALGARAGFSGPIVRGDVDTVRRHLDGLRSNPTARDVYRALALAALQYLPAKNKRKLQKELERKGH